MNLNDLNLDSTLLIESDTDENNTVGNDVADVSSTPKETLFHSAPWREAVEQAFGLEIRKFTPASDPSGVAFYSLISDIRGDRVVCTPFSDFCDPLLSEDGWNEFANHLRSYQVPVTVRPFRNEMVANDKSFELRKELLWHGIDLRPGAEAVWDGLKGKLRTKIRRAPKEGVSLRISSSMDDVAAFHKMHVNLRKSKYGLLAQPLSFFEELAERFGDDMAVILAEKDGDPVAGMVFFAWNGVWYYKFGASYEADYRPNAAMIIEACREAETRGLELLDLGRSDIDQPGLVQFKRQFNSQEMPLTTLHWQPSQYVQPIPELGKTLGAVTSLLTDPAVPDEVTARGGELLYRFFG